MTQEFESLAHGMAANAGRPGLRVHVLPYPLESIPDEEVRAIARAHWDPLLETLGARFHERLDELNLPRYRMEVTSAMRTTERQAELRRTNANAASGVSSHEFGATVDLSYAAFAPPAETPPTVPENAPADFHPHLERITELALESLSARKSRELGRVFSQVLEEAQAEGSALVIYERQQTVYHVTARRQDGA